MAYKVKFNAFCKEHNDTFIGGTRGQIEKIIFEYCPTAQILSFEPTDLTEDELKETHNEIDIDHCKISVYRAKAY